MLRPINHRWRLAVRAMSRETLERSPESLAFEVVVRGLLHRGAAPLRSDIDLRLFRRFARWMAIAEPAPAEERIMIKLAGSGLYEFFRRDLTHTNYLDLAHPEAREFTYQSALTMIGQPCGLWQQTPIDTAETDRQPKVEFTVFPIVDDSSKAGQLILYVHHAYTDASGYPDVFAVRQSQVWDWIDLGHGVPAVVGAAP